MVLITISYSGKYTMEFIKTVLLFVHSNAIDLRQSAPPYKPQIC